MKKDNIITVLVAVVLGVFAVYFFKPSSSQNLDRVKIKEFSLNGAKGPVALSDLSGSVLVMYLGFTHCPDICPNSLGKLSKKLKSYPKELKSKITPVFVSVDWKRDTPKTVVEYASYFSKKAVGLSGNRSNIDILTKGVGAFYQFVPLENSALEFTVDHTSRFFVFDKNGLFVRSFTSLNDENGFTETLKMLASEI